MKKSSRKILIWILIIRLSESVDASFIKNAGVTFKKMTKTTLFCDSGDSSGLVYMYYNGEYKPAGLIKGHGSSYSIYTKASEVVEALNVYPY